MLLKNLKKEDEAYIFVEKEILTTLCCKIN
jgi:hypothetical protein